MRPAEWTRAFSIRERSVFPRFVFFFFVLILLFPYRIEYGWVFFSTISVLDITLALLFPIVVLVAIARRRLTVGDKMVFIVLLMPLVFALISIAWTICVTTTLKSVVVYGAAVAALLLTIEFSKGYSFYNLALFFILIPLVLILTSIVSYFPGSPLRPELTMPSQTLAQDGFLLSYHARLSHPFLGLSNSFGSILAMFLPFVLLVRRVGILRRFSWWVATIIFAAIVATGSRGVLLAVVVVYIGLFVWRLLSVAHVPKRGFMFVAMALIVAALFIFTNPVAQKHLADRLSFDNVVSRLDAFSAVFGVLNEAPWGIGSGVALSDASSLSLRSVHNAYLQNFLWFGWGGGLLLNFAILALPFMVLQIPVHSRIGQEARRAAAISVVILLLINLSQASWEGSVLRVWIYFLIGLGVVMIYKADRNGLERFHG